MAKTARTCPCHSGVRYTACCAPIHGGIATADSPEALMRSRYAAFALGLGDYLVDTLASEHPDRGLPRDDVARELGRQKARLRYMGLTVLVNASDGDEGEVIFIATLFEKGKDRSFAERSHFIREGGRWRYLRGTAIDVDALPPNLDTVGADDLRALFGAHGTGG